MALTGSTEAGPPPGLAGAPPGLDMLLSGNGGEADKESVDVISKDMMQSTDEMLQHKVNQLISSAAGQLQTKFDRQQEQVNSSLEVELQTCREKVKSLEADKLQMYKTVVYLQEQLAGLTAHVYGQKCGWPNQGPQPMAGNFVNAGMAGPFATFPSGLPVVPSFPAMTEKGDVSQPSTRAPPSPCFTASGLSLPPTPGGAPFGPPCMAPPPPPPGLPGLEDSEFPLLPQACSPPMGPPPGLSDPPFSVPAKPPSAAISLCEAIEATPDIREAPPKPVLEEKVRLTPEEMHREALQFMQTSFKDCAEAADRFSSPKPGVSPGMNSLGFSPSRNMLSPKYPGLNTTPTRRTPRLTNGRLTPGMKSPAVAASPFVICESGGTIFGFTIRKADDCSLGLDVNHTDMGNCLEVTGVKPGGAMQAWNKQCVGGPAAGKAVMIGDRIVKVNDATTPKEMLQICREQKLLKFTVQRGECDDEFDALSSSIPASSSVGRDRGVTY